MATNTITGRGRQTLVQASREWSTRPADQRFWTLSDLFNSAKQHAEESVVKTLPLRECRVVPLAGDDLGLSGPSKGVATFQNYSFGQLCSLAQAPAAYLRGLPAPIAAANLNYGLDAISGEQVLMFHQNGGLRLRCVTSQEYSRIWNYQVAEMALALEESYGWRTPPARPCGLPGVPVRKATQADVLQKASHKELGVQVGHDISPSGLYESDHDCFIFQINEDRAIDAGGGEMLYRGVFWSNSEVGDAKFRGTLFLFDSVCGNHIVWGAKIVGEIAIPHRGNAQEIFREAMAKATLLVDATAHDDQKRILQAKEYEIAPTRDLVIKKIFGKDLGLSKTECESAWTLATRHAEDHGTEPNTAWGYAAGVTRLSQGVFADKRVLLDKAAGRIMEMAF